MGERVFRCNCYNATCRCGGVRDRERQRIASARHNPSVGAIPLPATPDGQSPDATTADERDG